MVISLMPKTAKFFDLFDQQVDNVVKAAELLKKQVNSSGFDVNAEKEMHEIEHAGDVINHRIVSELNTSFITPFDREDILSLAMHMDDVLDGIYLITSRMNMYELSNDDEYLKKFADVIEKSAFALAKAVKAMREGVKNMKFILEQNIEINRLENEGDVLRNTALINLFKAKANDPISVIKWKEIYEAAETTIDACEYTTGVLESILIKNN